MAAENWHASFNPQKFMSRVNIDKFIVLNEAYNENKVDEVSKPCILCQNLEGPGLLLNDKSYLCKKCFKDISTITYPEKYEKAKRKYIQEGEARRLARDAFIESCGFRKTAKILSTCASISLLLLFLHVGLLVVPGLLLFVSYSAQEKHKKKLDEWNKTYPEPSVPLLRHFHDPSAELSTRDVTILKVFNNWPGYPPFWNYLREVILTRDKNRCQVSGCPSRVSLHIHHMTPVSKGGEHKPTNLLTLCDFHHALEPDEGHERIWGSIKTRYFTLVREHTRHNRASEGFHDVCAHVRRLELISEAEIKQIQEYYVFSCPSCLSTSISITVNYQNKKVAASCNSCSQQWTGARALTEETGPRLAELLPVTRNKGRWNARWDMLSSRTDNVFATLSAGKPKQPIKSKSRKTMPDCPKCGSPMKLIRPRSGQRWKQFWGCTKHQTTGCNGSKEG